MSGKKLSNAEANLEALEVTPEMARKLLESNTNNRPISTPHVQRIVRQIQNDQWQYNGDTIKVSRGGDVLDGQHRLWACIEANKPIYTVIVRGIEKEAFATIDTIRRSRSGADILALSGLSNNRKAVSTSLQWLIRWQRHIIEDYRAGPNKIENSDIEEAFFHHPDITKAADRTRRVARVANHGMMTFLYYVFASHNQEIAERMIQTLETPGSVGIDDPFFRLRAYFLSEHHRDKDALTTIALAIKAANYAYQGKDITVLKWVGVGKTAEQFPILHIGRPHEKKAGRRATA